MTMFMYVTVPISGFVIRAVGSYLNPEEGPGQEVIEELLKENKSSLLLPKSAYIPSSDGSGHRIVSLRKKGQQPMGNLQSVNM
jgi:hypothetical protein